MESMPTSSLSPGDAQAANQSSHYGDASFLDKQMRLIDFVPRRLTILAFLLITGVAIIAGLAALHAWQSDISATDPQWRLAAFDLSQRGCLADWFSSLLLLAAGGTALLTYTIRRHRTDDYRGRYRIWLWAALFCFLSAADVAANLHEILKQIMIRLTKTGIWGNGTLWWIIPYFLIFVILGLRLMPDMRECRLGVTAFFSAAAAYLFAVGMELGLASFGDAAKTEAFRSAAAMFGHLMLLMSLVINARFVILDAEGLLPRSKPENSADSGVNSAEKSTAMPVNKWVRADQPSGTPQPALTRAPSPVSTNPSAGKPVFINSTASQASVTRKLTKQEKKALRDRLLRERLERQRRFGS